MRLTHTVRGIQNENLSDCALISLLQVLVQVESLHKTNPTVLTKLFEAYQEPPDRPINFSDLRTCLSSPSHQKLDPREVLDTLKKGIIPGGHIGLIPLVNGFEGIDTRGKNSGSGPASLKDTYMHHLTPSSVQWDNPEKTLGFVFNIFNASHKVSMERQFSAHDKATIGNSEYELFATISYMGVDQGGHYVAYLRDEDGWLRASDSVIERRKEPWRQDGELPYIVFYKRSPRSPEPANQGTTSASQGNDHPGTCKKVRFSPKADHYHQVDKKRLLHVLDVQYVNQEVVVFIAACNEEREQIKDTIAAAQKSLKDAGMTGVIVIVFDGEEKMSQGARELFSPLLEGPGVVCKRKNGGKMLVYTVENSPWLGIPNNFVLGVKKEGKGKVDSQEWAFENIARKINPEFLMLLDAGTKPHKNSLKAMIQRMRQDARVAGCCGELRIPLDSLLSLVSLLQKYEYLGAHVLWKTMEHVLGFIPVLPGAFSCYRWADIKEYLKEYYELQEAQTALGMHAAQAEDRLLSILLVINGKRLAYLSTAVASVDKQTSLLGLMKQRKRWILGALAMLILALQKVSRSRSIFLYVLVAIPCTILGYFAPAIYFAFLLRSERTLVRALSNDVAVFFARTLSGSFMALICVLGIMSICISGRDLKKYTGWYTTLWVMLTGYNVIVFGTAVDAICQSGYETRLASGAALAFTHIIAHFFHRGVVCQTVKDMTTMVFLGLLYAVCGFPLYLFILVSRAFGNFNDFAWGTRPGSTAESVSAQHGDSRLKVVLMWLTPNFLLAVTLFVSDQIWGATDAVLKYIVLFPSLAIVGIQLICLVMYRLSMLRYRCCVPQRRSPEKKESLPADIESGSPSHLLNTIDPNRTRHNVSPDPQLHEN